MKIQGCSARTNQAIEKFGHNVLKDEDAVAK